MKLFMLHENSACQDDQNLICLPDRFSWFAFLLPPVWALANRQWLAILAMVLMVVLFSFAGHYLIFPAFSLYILAALWLGFEANSLIGHAYARRGWRTLDPVPSFNRLRAEQHYFQRKKRRARYLKRQNDKENALQNSVKTNQNDGLLP